MNVHRRGMLAVAFVLTLLLTTPALSANALAPGSDPFQRTWSRTDSRSPPGRSSAPGCGAPPPSPPPCTRPTAKRPATSASCSISTKPAWRSPTRPPTSTSHWYVTNGLLVVELITGRMQIGDDHFDDRASRPRSTSPAIPTTPTARPTPSFDPLRSAPPAAENAPITSASPATASSRRPRPGRPRRHRRRARHGAGDRPPDRIRLLGLHEQRRARSADGGRIDHRPAVRPTRSTPPACRSPKPTGRRVRSAARHRMS